MPERVLLLTLPDTCLLKILYKLKPSISLCRLRRASKKLDEFVECNRTEIAKRQHSFVNLEIKLYQRFSGEYANSVSFEEALGLLKELKLRCHSLIIERANNQDEVLKIVEFTSASSLWIHLAYKISLEPLVSSDYVQNIDKLQIDIDYNKGGWKFPEAEVLLSLKNMKSLNFDFRNQEIESYKGKCFFLAFMKDVFASGDIGKLHRVKFIFRKMFDPSTSSENYYPVYRNAYELTNYSVLDETLIHDLPENFLVVQSHSVKHITISKFVRMPDYQNVTIKFCQKSIAHLRKTLIFDDGLQSCNGEFFSDTVVKYIMKKVVK